jgi:peptidoglycan/xylan/chitin deacetylase (PgdA/CDA1 family)
MKLLFKKIGMPHCVRHDIVVSAALISLLSLALMAAAFLYFLPGGGYHPPILMYHHVLPKGGNQSKLVVDLAYFEKQMAFLKKRNYRVLPLDQFFLLILKNKPIPKKSVAITFDDGYEDNYTYAYPILKKFKFPATIFLIAGKIGANGYLNWNQISEMTSHNIQFGNHTTSHPNLTEIDREAVHKEIYDADRLMNTKLRSISPIFAYPSGAYNQIVIEEVKQMNYSAAVSASVSREPAQNMVLNDRYGFKRVRISNSSKNLWVFWLVSSGYYPALKKLKYRLREIRKSLFNPFLTKDR